MNDGPKAYNQAILFLTARARSILETENNLKKKGFDPELIDHTISRLKQENLLDDREFAALFVESRERFRPKSRFALGYELKKKGISTTIIHEALQDVDDGDAALRAVKAKIGQWQKLNAQAFKKKVMNHLRNRGFSYEVSISTLKSLNYNDNSEDEL